MERLTASDRPLSPGNQQQGTGFTSRVARANLFRDRDKDAPHHSARARVANRVDGRCCALAAGAMGRVPADQTVVEPHAHA